ncbi:hypothetical protein JCM19232_3169 [Vibrio ishigakensis]|uniref:Uncharacterized protein n=1 Tax=Vibrio ishigakensis TaxID=1481914 RepID=A0A0B8PF00_9VIBR|nr:hypothetical protein JCM19232_3169 [Vibrio ishigakensis]
MSLSEVLGARETSESVCRAGIVPGSHAEHEWQELDKKMSTLLSLITEQSILEQAS